MTEAQFGVAAVVFLVTLFGAVFGAIARDRAILNRKERAKWAAYFASLDARARGNVDVLTEAMEGARKAGGAP